MTESDQLQPQPHTIASNFADRNQFLPSDVDALLYGTDPTPGIVAAEFRSPNQILLYQRMPDNSTVAVTREFRPWMIARDPDSLQNLRPAPAASSLRGGETHPLATLLEFDSWDHYRRSYDILPARSNGIYQISAPVSQFLMRSGVTLFKEMSFEDLRRLQLDIETLSLDPKDPDGEIVMIAMKMGDREELLFLETDERDLLVRFVDTLNGFDPDVIEGHNIYNFDLPYLIERARRWQVPLRVGRDGSAPLLNEQQQRFRVGPVSLPYTLVYIHGRHIVDTYQQVQRFDTAGRLSSYALKNAIRALGLERQDREFVAGEEIAELWRNGERDRERLGRYAMDDVRDVDLLARVTIPTEFYQTQILPMTFQRTTVTGTGRKIDDLMVRAYLAAGHGLPVAGTPRPYPGGFTELLRSGIFGPIVKCDVESLYPSIMLHDNVASTADTLRAFPVLLRELTKRRIDAKQRARQTTGEEHALWDGLQSSFKVLINSFYGYLGFGGGLFNDFDAAEQVTLEGQRMIQRVVAELDAEGAQPIEVDTDGVYFTPPDGISSEDEEEAFIAFVGATALPDGVRLAHDGRYEKMLSLKLKTYALLDYDGTLTLKGSALRSRRMERCFLRFIHDAARDLMRGDRDEVRDHYFALAESIQQKTVDPKEISQWTMVNRNTLEKQPRFKALLDANPGRWRFGERVEIYEREDGSLGLLEDYARDENTRGLLRRLSDTAARFTEAFPTQSEFDAFFPKVTPTTRLSEAREAKPVQQLSLFGGG
ncbi:MAG TPA: 3'-5' exonuclease [Thermomicrobiales bacterium]|nr:3'-5' exonuclease [Thermomicrobiales bacterium]